MSQHDSSGTLFLYTDHLGTPRYATDANRDVLWSWESDPFGEALPDEDVDGDTINRTVHLRFPGQYYDGELQRHYNYFRTYSPSSGRYETSDPIGLNGGISRFVYVANSPLGSTDEYGLLVGFVAEALVVAVCYKNSLAANKWDHDIVESYLEEIEALDIYDRALANCLLISDDCARIRCIEKNGKEKADLAVRAELDLIAKRRNNPFRDSILGRVGCDFVGLPRFRVGAR